MRAVLCGFMFLVGCHGDAVVSAADVGEDALADGSGGDTNTAPLDSGAVETTVLPSDAVASSDSTDATDAPASIHGFVSTPGWVGCGSATDKCYWSKAEYCCRATAGSSSFACKTSTSCAVDLHYKCDEAADCVGQPCAETPSGGSLCSNEPTWRKLCLTDAECASKECVDYPGWPGHGMCKS